MIDFKCIGKKEKESVNTFKVESDWRQTRVPQPTQ
jgi:hypothetical protein